MSTTELNQLQALPTELQHMALAIGIIMDRLARLSPEDSALALDLLKDQVQAKVDNDEEALSAAHAGLMELLEQRPVTVERIEDAPPAATHQTVVAYREWVSRHLRAERTKAKLTQEDLAERSGLPQSHISRIENQQLTPTRATIEKLAAALGVSIQELDFNEEGPCAG